MRTLITAIGIVLLASTACPAISAHVFHADEQTPLPLADPNVPDVYQDIMVGTRLTIFIVGDDNDANGWSGQLWHSWEYEAIGSVSGRDDDPNTRGYEGSCLPAAAGPADPQNDRPVQQPTAEPYVTPDGTGISFRVGRGATAGEWFVVDYHAKTPGTCELGLYTLAIDGNDAHPGDFWPGFGAPTNEPLIALQALSFHHVASRDLTLDDIVDFRDFALLASAWQTAAIDPNQPEQIPTDPNEPPAPSPDLNADDIVDIDDLAMFSAYWLERTDVNLPTSEPNAVAAEEYPLDI